MENTCCAVIVAAGGSIRMGEDISKQFLPLAGVPAIVHTLRAFEAAASVSEVVLVSREEDISRMEHLLEAFHINKVKAVVPGGSTRQQSAAAGVRAAGGAAYVAVHDGARVLITPQEIDKVVNDAFVYGASALGVPVKDTVKVAGTGGIVQSTPDRSTLWAIQTPQVFSRRLYLTALSLAEAEQAEYTDDCQLAERAGARVHICRGEYTNLKLTTRDDIPVAESMLKGKRGGVMRIGHGYDVHRLQEGRKLILGGVEIPYEKGLLGHSDADVLTHAICDALLGAAALGDIGLLFPDSDPAYLGADSIGLLEKAAALLREKGFSVGNIDATVIAQAPRLRPYVQQMRETLAAALGADISAVSVKATTEEGLGFTGRGEGISAHAVCTLA